MSLSIVPLGLFSNKELRPDFFFRYEIGNDKSFGIGMATQFLEAPFILTLLECLEGYTTGLVAEEIILLHAEMGFE